MAANLGTLSVFLKMDTRQFSKGVKRSKKSMSAWKKATVAGVLAGTAAITAFSISAVKAFGEQEKAEKKLAQVLKSTDYASGFDIKPLKEFASELQKITTFGDEAIISTQALLATFTNIKGDVFKGATETILDMSAALGQDLKSSTIQLGKALNDPIKGITALSRVGVSFTENQISQIKKLTKENKSQKAQMLILTELQKEFGGQAKAAAEGTLGKLTQLSNAWGDMQEKVGEAIIKSTSFGVVTDILKGKIEGFTESIAKNMNEVINTVALFAIEIKAAFKAMITSGQWLFEAIEIGLFDLVLKIGETLKWVFNAVGELVSGLWGTFKSFFSDVADNFKNLGTSIWDFLKNPLKGFDFNLTSKQMAKAFSDIKISPLEFVEIKYPDLSKKLAEIDKERIKELEVFQIKTNEAINRKNIEDKKKISKLTPDTTKVKIESSVIKAVQKGSSEALKLESQRSTKEDKIEKNTKKTATGIDKMVKLMSKSFSGEKDTFVLKGVF